MDRQTRAAKRKVVCKETDVSTKTKKNRKVGDKSFTTSVLNSKDSLQRLTRSPSSSKQKSPRVKTKSGTPKGRSKCDLSSNNNAQMLNKQSTKRMIKNANEQVDEAIGIPEQPSSEMELDHVNVNVNESDD